MHQLLEFCLCRLLESLDHEEDAELLMTAAQACKRCVNYACVRWELHTGGRRQICVRRPPRPNGTFIDKISCCGAPQRKQAPNTPRCCHSTHSSLITVRKWGFIHWRHFSWWCRRRFPLAPGRGDQFRNTGFDMTVKILVHS